MVRGGIFEYRRTGEVINNNKIGSGFEVTTYIQKNDLTKNYS